MAQAADNPANETSADDAKGDAGFFVIPLTSLRVDSVTDFDIYFRPRPDQPYVLYAERNVRFTEDARQRLVDNNVQSVFIRADQLAAYRRYIESNLATLMADPAVEMVQKSEFLYASASGVVEALLDDEPTPEGVQRTKDVARETVGFLLNDPQVFGCLLRAISSVYHIYTHSVNVVTYSVALGEFAGFHDPATLREMAIGALLHDIGKCRLDSAILDKPNPLTEGEWQLMREHPKVGYDLLSDTGVVGEIALDIVLHHHENMRGSGYPDGLDPDQLSPFVRIVTIADCFDALTTDRPFQRAMTSFDALSLMKRQIAIELDRDCFRDFVSLMGAMEE